MPRAYGRTRVDERGRFRAQAADPKVGVWAVGVRDLSSLNG
jgi:hypothetical protein